MTGLLLWLAVWLRRAVILSVLFVLGLGAPIAWTEATCRPPGASARAASAPLAAAGRAWAELPAEVAKRSEAALAAAVEAGDPHDFAFLPPLKAYWQAACAAVQGARAEGGLTREARLAIHGAGAAFTARLVTKAAYEETLGRIATIVRGEERAPLDGLSAEQGRGFAAAVATGSPAAWDHASAADALIAAHTHAPRDWERMIALNLEYRTRGFFRGLVRLPALPEPPAMLRAVVTGLDAGALEAIADISVVGPRSAGFQIETGAGPAAVAPLIAIARAGGNITDIAGASEVLVLATAPAGADPAALVDLPQPGAGVQILALPVAELAPALLRLTEGGARVERLLGN